MALTPLDIHNKEFNVKMRGYDQDQVNEFLDQVIKDYEVALKENQELKVSLKSSEEKIAYFNELKDALNQSIIVAQEAADKVKTEAQNEALSIQNESEKNAQKILNDATIKSNQILEDSSDRARQLTVGTDDLKKQTRVFRQRLQVMLESQLEIVKSQEWDQLLSQSMTNENLKNSLPPIVDKPITSDLNSDSDEVVDSDNDSYNEISSQAKNVDYSEDGQESNFSYSESVDEEQHSTSDNN